LLLATQLIVLGIIALVDVNSWLTVRPGDVVSVPQIDLVCSLRKPGIVTYCSRQSESPSRAISATKWRYFVYDESGANPVYRANRSP
jgi:hypothetical protein